MLGIRSLSADVNIPRSLNVVLRNAPQEGSIPIAPSEKALYQVPVAIAPDAALPSLETARIFVSSLRSVHRVNIVALGPEMIAPIEPFLEKRKYVEQPYRRPTFQYAHQARYR